MLQPSTVLAGLRAQRQALTVQGHRANPLPSTLHLQRLNDLDITPPVIAPPPVQTTEAQCTLAITHPATVTRSEDTPMTDPPNITAAAVPQTDNSQQQIPLQWQHTTALPDVATSPALEAAQLNDQEMTEAQTSAQQAHAMNETPPNRSNPLPALTTALQAQHHSTMELPVPPTANAA